MGILVAILVVLAIFWLISWTVGFLINLVIAALFWAAAGYIAVRIMGGDGDNWLQIILLGLIGGFLGSFILNALRLPWLDDIFLIGQIIGGAIGAVVLIAVVRLLGNREFAR